MTYCCKSCDNELHLEEGLDCSICKICLNCWFYKPERVRKFGMKDDNCEQCEFKRSFIENYPEFYFNSLEMDSIEYL